MCIAIYADGHLTVDLMLEALRPLINNAGQVECTHTFDLLLKNRSEAPITKLTVLYPRSIWPAQWPKDRDKNIECWNKPDNKTWGGKKMFVSPPKIKSGIIHFEIQRQVFMPSISGPSVRIKATLADPISVKIHPSIKDDDRSLFVSGWPTILEVELSESLRTFHPDDDKTSYFVRLDFGPLPFQPVALHRVPVTKNCELKSRVFSFVSPEIVADTFDLRLRSVIEDRARTKSDHKIAERLKDTFVDNGFWHPDHSTRVRDLRLGVVFDDQFMIYDTHETGALAFWQIRRLSGDYKDQSTAVWVSGSSHYPVYDPLALADDVLEHFSRLGNETRTGEEIAVAVGVDAPENVAIVIEALVKIGLLHRVESNALNDIVNALSGDTSDETAKKLRNALVLCGLGRKDGNLFAPSAELATYRQLIQDEKDKKYESFEQLLDWERKIRSAVASIKQFGRPVYEKRPFELVATIGHFVPP